MKLPYIETPDIDKGARKPLFTVGPRPADILFAVLVCIPVATLRPRWLLWVVPALAAIFVIWGLCARRARKKYAAMDAAEKYRGVDPGLMEEETK